MKLRLYSCKIVLATSLVWFITNVCLLMYYTDSIGDSYNPSCQSLQRQKMDSIPNRAQLQRQKMDCIPNRSQAQRQKMHSIPRAQRFIQTLQPSTTAVDDNFKYWNPVDCIRDSNNYACQSLPRQKMDCISNTAQSFFQLLQPSTTAVDDNFKYWNPVVVNSNPSHWPGEMGRAVVIPPEEEELQKETFKLNNFNLLASDRIALNRTLPDVRAEGCKNKKYAARLPSTSIVIVFHNEAWSTLLRTVHSVIRMSPLELIEEIILVDDASDREFLGKQLEEYVEKLPVPVKVLRTGKRSGIIRARLIGAAAAKGQVMTFLDAHCECTVGWLEPLLDRITEDSTRVVCPIIDRIVDSNFEYQVTTGMMWGGFSWKMHFDWYRVPQREVDRRNGDMTQPLRTPTMCGGLFAIDKNYFEKLGKYDEGMEIWGGENLELSFRIWMCGGTLEIVTCSHVGHVFRQTAPYTGGTSKIVNNNNARLAEVWLDEWKDFFYAITPSVDRNAIAGKVTERKELRKKLQCKSFRWYLENIYPETHLPLNYYHLGEIRNEVTNNCLDTYDRKNGENVGVSHCHGMGGNQLFAYTKRKQIMSEDKCLDASSARGPVQLVRCHGLGGNQFWEYDEEKRTIRHVITGKCLDKPEEKDLTLPLLKDCDGRISQVWIMKEKFKWQVP